MMSRTDAADAITPRGMLRRLARMIALLRPHEGDILRVALARTDNLPVLTKKAASLLPYFALFALAGPDKTHAIRWRLKVADTVAKLGAPVNIGPSPAASFLGTLDPAASVHDTVPELLCRMRPEDLLALLPEARRG